MKKFSIIFKIITISLVVNILTIGVATAQLNGFFLKPSGDTEDYMKYIRKAVTYSGTSYYTGYLTLSAYKNVTTGILANTGEPVQKLQLQGGNILLCRTNTASTTPDINPTSRNGAILFSDMVTSTNNWIHGKWGIEYDDQYSTGGLNFFKPVSSLTSSRMNFNFFIRNDGKVGIGTGAPLAKLHIKANITEDASILLEATGSGKNNSLMFLGHGILGTTDTDFSISFKTGIKTRMFINGENGNIGIGNNIDPQARLHISADEYQDATLLLEAAQSGRHTGIYFKGSPGQIATMDKEQPIVFYTGVADFRMKIDFTGNVGIGTENPQKKLHVAGNSKFEGDMFVDAGNVYVNGEIKAKKYLATLTPFPDYVFLPEYKLLTINEVERFIVENGHLPGLPDAATAEKNGIELGEMNALLLQKIEELTLYIIAQDKKIQALETVIISQQ